MQGALTAQIPEAEAYQLYADREQQCILLLTHKAVTAAALELLRGFGFTGGQLKGRSGTPEENLTGAGGRPAADGRGEGGSPSGTGGAGRSAA